MFKFKKRSYLQCAEIFGVLVLTWSVLSDMTDKQNYNVLIDGLINM